MRACWRDTWIVDYYVVAWVAPDAGGSSVQLENLAGLRPSPHYKLKGALFLHPFYLLVRAMAVRNKIAGSSLSREFTL